MFKIMLGNEKKKKFTAYFLSLILKRDRKEIEDNMEFIKNDLDQDKFMESKRSVDIIIRLGDKIYNIEMNNNKNVLSLERNIDYATRLYASSGKRGNKRHRYMGVLHSWKGKYHQSYTPWLMT